MPKWLVITLSAVAALAVGVAAAVVVIRSSDPKPTASTPTTVPVPEVAGTVVSAPTTSTTVAVPPSTTNPTPAPAPAPSTVTRTITVVPGTTTPTTAPPTTTTAPVPAASGIGSVTIIDAPKVAGAPSDVIVRSVAQAQVALGTSVVPLWVAQFPFNQFALVLSTVAPDNDRAGCYVPDEIWSRNGAVLAIRQRVLCYGGTDFSGNPVVGPDPDQRRVAGLALPLPTVAGVTTVTRI